MRQQAATTPRFDSETVREVLARASEIETQQAETEPLTAAQAESLGSELGLSPDAVRRALGEKMGANREAATVFGTGLSNSLAPLTQEQVKAAYQFNLWYALLCFPVIFGLLSFMRSGSTPQGIGSSVAIMVGLVISIFLESRSGFLAKRVKVGAVGGLISVLLVSIVGFLASAMVGGRVQVGFVLTVIFLYALLGAFAGAIGASARYWWDSLPRNSDRYADLLNPDNRERE